MKIPNSLYQITVSLAVVFGGKAYAAESQAQ